MSPIAGGRIDIPVEPDLRGFDSKLGAGLRKSTGAVGSIIKGLGVAVAAGAAVGAVGLRKVIDVGTEYQDNLNELQAVSQATALDMRKVGETAKALGADMTLPATSAADAAAAMVELAKGGLDVNDAMKAAKGTLQLAAAAQVDAAQAAEIQSNALNEFGLAADQAGHVADVLANTANAASGSIIDMANALKFVGPVAKGLGVSIDSVSAAIGLLANNGIQGEQAGTSLRGILASLASPSKAAAEAMKQLGIVAFDQKGQFVGLRAITEQLAKAKSKLTQEEFAAAASTAFGNEGFTAANALANEGATAFDEMATAVSRAGGAADVAGAKTKGLGGAIEGFKSQVETAGIGIFDAISGPLETGVRKAADAVASLTPAVVSGVENAVAAGRLFGPSLADALRDRASVIGDAVHDVLGPLAETVPGLLNAGVNAAIDLWNDFTDVLSDVVDAAAPVARGIADVAKAAVAADGPLSAAGAALGLAGDAAKVAAGFLVPIGKIVGGIVSAFADLPGPIQTAVIALGIAAAMRGPLGSLGDTIKDRVTAPFKAMGEEVRLQQALLTGSTNIMSAQVGKVGLAMAALESRVPVIGKLADAYRSGSAAAEGFVRSHASLVAVSQAVQGASERTVGAIQGAGGALANFSGVVTGTTKAVGVGLRSALTGLVGAVGGPWGAAIAGASIGLSLLAGAQESAARRAREHAQFVSTLADALRESSGAINDNIRSQVAKQASDDKLLDDAKGLGIAYEDVTDAILNQGPALDAVRARLQAIVDANKVMATDEVSGTLQWTGALEQQGLVAQGALDKLNSLAGGFVDAQEKQRALDEAIRNGNVSMLDATATGRDLSKAMDILRNSTSSADDKARALKEALDALSGDAISLEAAQAKVHEQVARLTEGFKANGSAADVARRNTEGFGKALINADGSINTTLPNGRRLLDFMRDFQGTMADVAQRTFDAARAQGDDLPTALAKARQAAEGTRQELIKSHDQLGLTAGEAENLANRYNLLPDRVATLISAPGMDGTQLELIILRDLVNKVPPDKPILVRSLSDEAKKKLEEIGFIVRTLPNGDVEIIAKDQAARSTLNKVVEDFQNKTITIQARIAINAAAVAKEIRLVGGALGHIVHPYAAGGIERKLTPMKAGLAAIVPPNTWRVVGDRLVDDEAYIPINRSARSTELLRETASRMGFDLIRRFALGGFAQVQSSRDMLRRAEQASVVVENLHLHALSDRFRIDQVAEELRFAGIH